MNRIHHTSAPKRQRLAETWDLIGPFERATDAREIKAHLLDVASASGLSSLFAGWVPSLSRPLAPTEVVEKILHDHTPGEWSLRYVERAYVHCDPIVARLQRHHMPFTWTDAYETCPSRTDAALIDGEASSFGLRQGYVVPVSLLGQLTLAFSFGGTVVDIDQEALSRLTFVTNVAAGQLVNLVRCHGHHERGELTGREVDCLSWAAEGKTDEDVASILGISRFTVIKHLVSAREKLDAMNKSHAVSKALRLKIIR